MYAIKIIGVHKEGRQLIELISGSKVNYEYGTYKDSDDFGEQILKLLGDRNHYQYHGNNESKKAHPDKPKQFIVLSVFNGNEWDKHVIEDSWVFIMLNGKTIDKLESIV